jgi:uncharacterized repeat protein (TIGR03806 family)
MRVSRAFPGSLAVFIAGVALGAGCSSTPSSASGAAGTTGQAGSSGQAGTGQAGTGSQAGTTGTAGTGSAGTTGAAGSGSDGGAGTTGKAGTSGDGGTDAGTITGQCAPPADPSKPIEKLSQTGCVDPAHPTKFSSVLYPYEVNSPLWSDNADKSRAFAIPTGKKIHVKDCAANASECPKGTQDDGKWVMPVGTVMVKNFGFDGKLVETRLLVHPDATTWNGYSYQWNETQTEATVVPDDADLVPINTRRKVTFNTGTRMVDWIYPYRFDCGGCHTDPAGGTLGPETRQMNRITDGVGGKINQIDRWKTATLFETAPKTPYQAALVLPYDGQLGMVPAGATVEQRARSYMHANCAYCHRPDGIGVDWLDFRFDTPLKNTGACAMMPKKGEVGVAGALILKPTKPMESAMWLRMNAPYTGDKTRMPQLATYVVDAQGLKLIGDWITSITACPQ